MATADQQVTVMDYVFLPDTAGSFNWTPRLQEQNDLVGAEFKKFSHPQPMILSKRILDMLSFGQKYGMLRRMQKFI